MLRFLCLGDWGSGGVVTRWVPGTRRIVPEVEAAVEVAWREAQQRLGKNLFDGKMCRLEGFKNTDGQLELSLSPCTYKPFFGTHMVHPEFATQFGPEVMANPVGVSTVLVSGDGWLLLGQRSEAVAYYPGRVHPFAGSLEPEDRDVFSAAIRELKEELSVGANDLEEIRCLGMVQDVQLLQPELVFIARTSQFRDKIASKLSKQEHDALGAVGTTADDLHEVLTRGTGIRARALTPVAVGSILLWGRKHLGNHWFARNAAAVTSGANQ